MVDVIDTNRQMGRVDPVLAATQGPTESMMSQKIRKLHCHCHKPSASRMIECSNCGNSFHVSCGD